MMVRQRSRERTPRRSRAPADSRSGGRRRPDPPMHQRPVWQGGAATGGNAETSSGRPVFHGVPSTPNGRRRRRLSECGARSPLTISVQRGSKQEDNNGAPSLGSAASSTSLSHRLIPGLVLHGLAKSTICCGCGKVVSHSGNSLCYIAILASMFYHENPWRRFCRGDACGICGSRSY